MVDRRDVVEYLSLLGDDDYREIADEARGTHQLATDRRAAAAADMARKAAQLAELLSRNEF